MVDKSDHLAPFFGTLALVGVKKIIQYTKTITGMWRSTHAIDNLVENSLGKKQPPSSKKLYF